MLRLVFLLIILAALAFGFSQLADQPGDISVNWGNLHIEVSLLVGTIGLLLAVVVLSGTATGQGLFCYFERHGGLGRG